jgi:hypothetical protein
MPLSLTNFFLALGKPQLSTGLALVRHAPQRRVHPRHGIKHGMGRKVRQPFQSGLSLHADGDRLQLLTPEKFACGLIFGLLPLKQPVPEEAKRPGPLVQTASLLARGIEPRLPAANDHATSAFQRMALGMRLAPFPPSRARGVQRRQRQCSCACRIVPWAGHRAEWPGMPRIAEWLTRRIRPGERTTCAATPATASSASHTARRSRARICRCKTWFTALYSHESQQVRSNLI